MQILAAIVWSQGWELQSVTEAIYSSTVSISMYEHSMGMELQKHFAIILIKKQIVSKDEHFHSKLSKLVSELDTRRGQGRSSMKLKGNISNNLHRKHIVHKIKFFKRLETN